MPRAEVGSTKYVSNKLKSKGLQRLRWYCQVCEKQCRDENGFKCHVQSESHVRQIQIVGEDPKKYINDFSNQFQRDFLQLLRTSHGEKSVHANHFYQTYISDKEHIHLNASKWASLTEFVKHLGREGICRVTEEDKGLHIAWIDNSPEALRRKEAVLRKERQDRGDEEREQRLIREQVERAQREAVAKRARDADDEAGDEPRDLQRTEGEKIKLSFGATQKSPEASATDSGSEQKEETAPAADLKLDEKVAAEGDSTSAKPAKPTGPVKMAFGGPAKPKNVFSSKKNPLAAKKVAAPEAPKKMSEMERIMREEMEQKRFREENGIIGRGPKRQRV